MLGRRGRGRLENAQFEFGACAHGTSLRALPSLAGTRRCKGAVVAVREALATGRYPFVLSSDARGYYANIRHTQLLEQLRRHVDDPVILDLVSQYRRLALPR